MTPSVRRIVAWRALLLAGLVPALFAWSCVGRNRGAGRGSDPIRPTPATGVAGPLEVIPRVDVITYARGLAFDTTRGSSDNQYLLFPLAGQLAVGPYAAIAPEIGARRLTKAQLKTGRIVARIFSAGAYAPWGLSADTTFVWIDSTAATSWRMVLIPQTAGNPVVQLALGHHDHPTPFLAEPCQLSRTRFIRHNTLMATSLCFRCNCEGWCSPTASGSDSAFAQTILTLR